MEKEETTAISKAVKDVVKQKVEGETVGLMNVIDILRSSDKPVIKEAGEYLLR